MRHPAFDPLTQDLCGTHSVSASAGTGKTWSITLLWLRLLVEGRHDIGQILVTTFTKAATAELKDRLLGRLREAQDIFNGEWARPDPIAQPAAWVVWQAVEAGGQRPEEVRQRLVDAASRFDLAPITTIHGFCQRLIARHALDLGLDPDAEVVASDGALVDQLVDDHVRRLLAGGVLHNGVEVLRKVARKAVETQAEVWPMAGDFAAAAAEAAKIQGEIKAQWAAGLAGTLSGRNAKNMRAALEAVARGEDWETTAAQSRDLEAQAPETLRLAQRYGELRKQLALAPLAAERTALIAAVRAALAEEKKRRALRTYDDILLGVRDFLANPAGSAAFVSAVRARFKAVIVDECQDTDAVQLEVFGRLFGGPGGAPSFIVIGDPKQSIYRFRGADLRSYRTLVAGAKAAPDMAVNHRSDHGLVESFNALYGVAQPLAFAPFPDSASAAPIGYVPVSAQAKSARFRWKKTGGAPEPVRIQWSGRDNREDAKRDLAAQSAAEIARLLAGGEVVDKDAACWRQVAPGDVAVLAFSYGDLRLVHRALERLGIPAVMGGRGLGSVLASEEAADVLGWLRAMEAVRAGRDARSALVSVLASPLGGMRSAVLVALPDADCAAQAGHLLACANLLEKAGPLVVLRAWLKPRMRDVLVGAGGERAVANWLHLAELLQGPWAAGARAPEALADAAARLMASADGQDEAQVIRLETDSPAVRLMTVHGSKGLEFPIVFCPFLWHLRSRQRTQASFATAHADGRQVLDVGSPRLAQVREAEQREISEELARQTYVALTRARHRLYLGLAPVGEFQNHQNAAGRSWIARLLLPALAPAQEESLVGLEADWEGALAHTRTGLAQAGVAAVQSDWPDAPPQAGADAPMAAPPEVAPWRAGILRTASYSAMVRQDFAHELPGLDDAHEAAGTAGPAPLGNTPDALQGLGAGTVFGTQLHGVFEKIVGESADWPQAFSASGVPEDARPRWQAQLAPLLAVPLPLGAAPATLESLRGKAVSEMRFLLPVRHLTLETLQAALGQAGGGEDTPAFAAWREGLGRMPIKDLRGFLQGYMDLVFEHGGRWFVADYKTNTRVGDGLVADLEAEMARHDYFLQAHFYVLALHRHLKATLEGYDYDTHMGGAVYLFLRAMGSGAPGRGLWCGRPPLARIRALEDLLEEAENAGGEDRA